MHVGLGAIAIFLFGMVYYLWFFTKVVIKKANFSVTITTNKRFQKEEDYFSLSSCESLTIEKSYQESNGWYGTSTVPWYGLVLHFKQGQTKILNPFGAMSSSFFSSKERKDELLKISEEVATFIGVPVIDNIRES